MALYVDGFVIPVPKKNMKSYLKMARMGGRIWKEHGALEVFECFGDAQLFLDGAGLVAKQVVFSWILFKSRASRDRVNAKVMKDKRMAMAPTPMPFDFKRMIYGGFTVAVKA